MKITSILPHYYRQVLHHSCLKSSWRVTSSAFTLRSHATSTLWIPPEGYDTGIMVYNSATRCKVPLKTQKKDHLTWYTCGPTVYDSAHIGHAICYVRLDIIRRILLMVFNIDVNMVMGITDIDDKIFSRATQLKINFKELTNKYEHEFFEDMKSLRILQPSITSRVTDNINNILIYIQQIINNGYAYSVEDGSVYFDYKEYKRPGKLKQMTAGEISRLPEGSLKKATQDFALWKGVKPEEPSWSTPWGPPGRPGWHIECSVMASRISGDTLDLHSGGIDLLFPHHENEETQCCAHDGTLQWCNYWIHTGHLYFKDRKMSKSLQNSITVQELLKHHSVNSFRLFCIEKHYRSNIEYDPEKSMNSAENNIIIIHSFLHTVEAYLAGQLEFCQLNDDLLLQTLSETKKTVKESFANDFHCNPAIDAIMNLIKVCNTELHKDDPKSMKGARSTEVMTTISSYLYNFFNILGLVFLHKGDISAKPEKFGTCLVGVMNLLITFRESIVQFTENYSAQEPRVLNHETTEEVIPSEENILLKAYHDLDASLLQTGLDIKNLDLAELLESGARLSQVMNLLLEFRTTVRLFASLQSTPHLYSNLSKSEKKKIRKERADLYTACDKLRDELATVGFLIKDTKTDSTWSINAEL